MFPLKFLSYNKREGTITYLYFSASYKKTTTNSLNPKEFHLHPSLWDWSLSVFKKKQTNKWVIKVQPVVAIYSFSMQTEENTYRQEKVKKNTEWRNRTDCSDQALVSQTSSLTSLFFTSPFLSQPFLPILPCSSCCPSVLFTFPLVFRILQTLGSELYQL